MASNPLFIILVVLFAAIAAGLLAYGKFKLKVEPRTERGAKTEREPRTETKSIPNVMTKPRKPETRTGSPDYFCQKCYAVIPEGLEFCSECGARQE